MMAAKGFDLWALFKPVAENLLSGALAGAKGEALKNITFALNQAREGSLRLLFVFRTPDGKIEHVRILMSPEEAMAACKSVFHSIKNEVDAAKGGGR